MKYRYYIQTRNTQQYFSHWIFQLCVYIAVRPISDLCSYSDQPNLFPFQLIKRVFSSETNLIAKMWWNILHKESVYWICTNKFLPNNLAHTYSKLTRLLESQSGYWRVRWLSHFQPYVITPYQYADLGTALRLLLNSVMHLQGRREGQASLNDYLLSQFDIASFLDAQGLKVCQMGAKWECSCRHSARLSTTK